MSRYKMIAFDMDGTLLASDKRVLNETKNAIQKASEAGKTVVVATGRPLAEFMPYKKDIPSVKWLVASSGSFVYDLTDDTRIFERFIDPDTVLKCLDIAKMEIDLDELPMINLHTKRSIVQIDQAKHMKDYCMAPYQELYDKVSTGVSDIFKFYEENPFSIGKLNLYHKSTESRLRSRQRMMAAGLDEKIDMVDGEISSLESTPKGINKAVGLEALCSVLGIKMREVIAVGDSDNDAPMLKAAGLGIAMGNANAYVKSIADKVVSDNDHNGCSQAINEFLLGELG